MNPHDYEEATRRIDAAFDIPQFDVSGLIRTIYENHGRLPRDRRARYEYLPEDVLTKIEVIVRDVFHIGTGS
ncbi:hypothetical protein PQR33_30520 [Paraburkholderia sediminicola]|uniref:hypothetical protein n=1 Tax=Paraburkholderia sediminicola TaxID=458836 RepID=UPI0038BDB569